MANAIHFSSFHAQKARVDGAFFANLWAKYQQHRMYRVTVKELSNLSGRELADLGLSRSSIKSAAYEAVYGA